MILYNISPLFNIILALFEIAINDEDLFKVVVFLTLDALLMANKQHKSSIHRTLKEGHCKKQKKKKKVVFFVYRITAKTRRKPRSSSQLD